MLVDTSGTAWSSCRITVRPFGSVNCEYGSSIFGGTLCAVAEGAAASATAVSNIASFITADSTAIANRRQPVARGLSQAICNVRVACQIDRATFFVVCVV